MKINRHYLDLPENYLFQEVAKRTQNFQKQHPEIPVIKLSIGDVSRPLSQTVVDAMQRACKAMGRVKTFRGYGPEIGYSWLREKLAQFYQNQFRVQLDSDEIIISDGAKSDVSNLLDIFANQAKVALCDPVYPVYWDTNIMLGRTPQLLRATKENNFLPLPSPDLVVDIIYICNPANPTGSCYNRAQLKQWVDYARSHAAIIIYDAAYACFVQDKNLPRSIYEIDGAKTCAIEIGSFSKMAGFTGVRCGWTIIPQALKTKDGVSLNQLWQRRQSTKFNGVSYIVQRGAEAALTSDGLKAAWKNIHYYQRNLRLLCRTLDQLQWEYVGGVNAPYLWVRCPGERSGWDGFDFLLQTVGVVVTPGIGFGPAGKNYLRFSAFNSYAQTRIACQRLLTLQQKTKFPVKK